jgi:vacuolar-type H+-ATPase subunit I/STV1
MIYLIESGNYYKIGSTKDVNARMSVYKTHNPNVKLIDVADVNDVYEKIAHDILVDLHYDREWFKKDQQVIDVFNHIKNGDYSYIDKQIKYKENEEQIKKLKAKNNEANYYLALYQNLLLEGVDKTEKALNYCDIYQEQIDDLKKIINRYEEIVNDYKEMANETINFLTNGTNQANTIIM